MSTASQITANISDPLTKAFVHKRLRLVPLVTTCIILEMVFMFTYICLTVYCRKDFVT